MPYTSIVEDGEVDEHKNETSNYGNYEEYVIGNDLEVNEEYYGPT